MFDLNAVYTFKLAKAELVLKLLYFYKTLPQ